MRIFTGNLPDDLVAQSLRLKDTRDWILKVARENTKDLKPKDFIRSYAYRPFDERYIYYSPTLIEFDRKEIMQHMVDNDNLGLSLTRRLRDPEWKHIYVSQFITDKTILSSRDNAYFFPLYLYSSKEKKGLFHAEGETKEPNIRPEIIKSLSKTYKKEVSPEEIFYHIYAVLYSETYRTKYAEFLKIDFPRVPFTKDYKLFKKMSEYGYRLIMLHLLKSQELDSPIARFQVEGDNRVEKPKYDDNAGRVYINKEQYFEGISQEIWSYQIGGYQVCDKWLKDRKDRVLSLDEIQTYCRIVTGINKTIEIQKAIDEEYGQIEETAIKHETTN